MTTTQETNHHTSKDTTMTASLNSNKFVRPSSATNRIVQTIISLGGVHEMMTDDLGVTYIVGSLTPKLAEALLVANIHNRNLRKAIAKNYSSDMASGKWLYAADPVRFSSEGALLDGQHRLLAASQRADDRAERTLFVVGLAPEAQSVMDQGRRRSPGQQLSLAGFRNATALASTVRLYLYWERDLIFRDNEEKSAITTATIQDYAVENPDMEEVVSEYKTVATEALMTTSAFLSFAVAASRADADLADGILRGLGNGSNLSEGSPVLALRNRNIKNKTTGRKDSDVFQLGFLIRTWNAVLEGRPIAKVQTPRGGSFNRENFPIMEGTE